MDSEKITKATHQAKNESGELNCKLTTRELQERKRTVLRSLKAQIVEKKELEDGYWWAYKEFYKWKNIFKASFAHENLKHKIKHLAYSGGWKKLEPMWNVLINSGALNKMLPVLESILSKVNYQKDNSNSQPKIKSRKALHLQS